MPKKLILIRHGRTKWNAERRYMGSTDIGLDTDGISQAEKLNANLSAEKYDRIYSSDSCRAFDFASIAFPGRAVIVMPELREMNFGVIEGMTHEEILAKYPKAYEEWLNDIHSAVIPEGESMQSLKERALKAFDHIVANNKGNVVAVVTHAGPIRVIMHEIAGSGDFWDVMPASASVSAIEFADGTPRITLINDTSHLQEI